MPLPPQVAVVPVLLRVLYELGGRARPSDVYPRVTERFPEIQAEDLAETLRSGVNRWINRIQWARQDLVLAGLVDRSERGVWVLTPAGEQLARAGASDAEIIALVRSPGRSAQQPQGKPDTPAEGDNRVVPPLQFSPVPPTSARLIEDLRSAAVDSRDPNRFEQVVAEVFRFLGFETEWIGGPGKTDVLVRAPLGIRRYSVVVDAKSTGRAKVADQQIDWLSIRTHREREHATYACVVGQEFAGGQLNARAQEFQVSLLTVDDLAEIVEIHAETPLTLSELRPVFEPAPTAKAVLPQIRAAAREHRRKRLLLVEILTHIDHFNRTQPDIILAKPETLLASILASRKDDLLGTTLDDVRRSLSLLETLGILSAVNGEGYVSETSREGAKAILTAFTFTHGWETLERSSPPMASSS